MRYIILDMENYFIIEQREYIKSVYYLTGSINKYIYVFCRSYILYFYKYTCIDLIDLYFF